MSRTLRILTVAICTFLWLAAATAATTADESPAVQEPPKTEEGAPAAKAVTAPEESPKWLTNFEEAKKLAAEKKRPILLDFTGSDWCIWCKRLKAEVFTEKAFQDSTSMRLSMNGLA